MDVSEKWGGSRFPYQVELIIKTNRIGVSESIVIGNIDEIDFQGLLATSDRNTANDDKLFLNMKCGFFQLGATCWKHNFGQFESPNRIVLPGRFTITRKLERVEACLPRMS